METAPAQRPHGVLGVWSPILSAVGNAFKIQVRLQIPGVLDVHLWNSWTLLFEKIRRVLVGLTESSFSLFQLPSDSILVAQLRHF